MRRGLAGLVFVLFAGCSSAVPDEPLIPRVDHEGDVEDGVAADATRAAQERFYLRDPDVLGLQAPGLRVLNFTNNATSRLSGALLTGTQNLVHWILMVPSGALQNRTQGCAPGEPSWRIKHYGSGIDTLTNQPLAAGNWTLVVHAERLSNLTLLFNTTNAAGYRPLNGSLLGWRAQTVDADPRIESDNSPYRVSFNKTFQIQNRSWILGHFGVRGDGFAQFREIRSKVEATDGFLCGEHRNVVPQPVVGATLWNSLVHVQLGEGGAYSYVGRFESTTAVNPRPFARADVLFLT